MYKSWRLNDRCFGAATGLTALHLAVRARHVGVVRVLLASGATMAADHAGYTPLHWIVDDTSDIDAVNESMTPGEHQSMRACQSNSLRV